MMIVVVIEGTGPQAPTVSATATVLAELAPSHELVVVCADSYRPRHLAVALRRALPRFTVSSVLAGSDGGDGLRTVGQLVEAGALTIVCADHPAALAGQVQAQLGADMVLELVADPTHGAGLRWPLRAARPVLAEA